MNYFKNNEFLKSLIDEISSKTSFNFRDKIENIKSFPIFVSDKFKKPQKSITKGQFIALYQNMELICSGVIDWKYQFDFLLNP